MCRGGRGGGDEVALFGFQPLQRLIAVGEFVREGQARRCLQVDVGGLSGSEVVVEQAHHRRIPAVVRGAGAADLIREEPNQVVHPPAAPDLPGLDQVRIGQVLQQFFGPVRVGAGKVGGGFGGQVGAGVEGQ